MLYPNSGVELTPVCYNRPIQRLYTGDIKGNKNGRMSQDIGFVIMMVICFPSCWTSTRDKRGIIYTMSRVKLDKTRSHNSCNMYSIRMVRNPAKTRYLQYQCAPKHLDKYDVLTMSMCTTRPLQFCTAIH